MGFEAPQFDQPGQRPFESSEAAIRRNRDNAVMRLSFNEGDRQLPEGMILKHGIVGKPEDFKVAGIDLEGDSDDARRKLKNLQDSIEKSRQMGTAGYTRDIEDKY